MTKRFWPFPRLQCKPLFMVLALACAGCSPNPATGESQFSALMTPAREESVGAGEHAKIVAAFGVLPAGDPAQAYVEQVGRKIVTNTERPEVSYKFFVLDTPVVNAFSLPGGYIYVTRGLLALANDESELAAVLAHETGHITARHAAARYSEGMLTSLGTVALITAAGAGAAASGLDPDIFTQSYSRHQESEADTLGIRYLSRAGYDPSAMARFLEVLEAHDTLQHKLDGAGNGGAGFFATHPSTADRVTQARSAAAGYPKTANPVVNHAEYLKAIDGLVYDDSERQGFVRSQTFWHPALDFTFTAPAGFTLSNQPAQVVAKGAGAIAIFDSAAAGDDPRTWLTQTWLKGEKLEHTGDVDCNGLKGTAADFQGFVNGRPVTILVAVMAWSPGTVFRFQAAVPKGAPDALKSELRDMACSLRHMTAEEKKAVHPWRLHTVIAQTGDTAAGFAARLPFDSLKEEHFRVLNGLKAGENPVAGQSYKIIDIN